ncbi:hypothetical protein WOLCODRAFT_137834 [Wolfiporia cocos MD-104 SS10]|uniref:F-box domain-containing protein n=1 Tax=Wolfiporia cocos (strain MD-104) TaxID=742152 RepID=A0A2H3JZW6_WOLCO|nr:hypothetical protein WOLCODRAFT_137834 [Wolfiporia cocos MD-104 SS10]
MEGVSGALTERVLAPQLYEEGWTSTLGSEQRMSRRIHVKTWYPEKRGVSEFNVVGPKSSCNDHVRRFFHTFEGFHEGSSDLVGRSRSRYMSLKRRLTQFVADLELLKRHYTITESMAGHDMDTYSGKIEHGIKLQSLVVEFKAKYQLTDSECPWREWLTLADEASKLLATNQEPLFQRTYLSDLSPELLSYIFNVSEDDVVHALAATCRVLYNISLPYKHRSQCIVHKCSVTDDDGAHYGQQRWSKEKLKNHAIGTAQKFLGDIELIYSRPDVIKRSRELTIRSEWKDYWLNAAGFSSNSLSDIHFRAPLRHSIGRVLSNARNVTHLELDNIRISVDTVISMTSMHRLRSLVLKSCLVLLTGIGTLPPPLPQIINATFVHCQNFNILSVLPNVKTVAIVGSPTREICLPGDLAGMTWNLFHSAERVMITYPDHRYMHRVIDWISAATREHGSMLRLTHFKLETQLALDHQVIFDLLAALRGAPLQVLSLVGLSFARPELLEHLADGFPLLRSITLVHRRNMLYGRTAPSVWPEPTWEYAARLARLSNLQYFSWNFDMRSLRTGTTCDLPLLEEGYPEGQRCDDDDDLYFTEWHAVAKLFAAHCLTLRRLVFLADHRNAEVEFAMYRDVQGKMTVRQDLGARLDEDYHMEANPDIGCNVEAWALGTGGSAPG